MDHPAAIIFDFDGLIADTESAIYLAWRELYQSHGHDLPLSTYVRCVGSTFHTYNPMQELENLLGYEPDWSRLIPAKDQRIIDLHVELDALPGVRDLLADARAQGIPTAVASSSDSSHVFRWLDRLELRGSFDVICTRDDVCRAKPAPDLFLLASSRLDIPREAAVVLEDSENGLKAAVAAEIPCIIVPNQITQHSDFSRAAAILPTLEGVGARELFRAVR